MYVEGNAARKLQAVRRAQYSAEERRRRERERQQILADREMDHRARQERLRHKTVAIDVPYLVMLIIASAFTLGLCFNYIRLQTEINSHIHNIERQEQRLDRLKSENDALKNSIDTSVDLGEIYRIATQELGMVYAGEGQVITFDKTESEFVRQYEDIPKY